jgi:hypothetical protein
MWKLLIIEPFFQWKRRKIETEKIVGIWGRFVMSLGSPRQVRFNRVYFIIFRAKVWVSEWMLLLKIQKIAKIGFRRKNQLSCQCVHFAEFRNFQLWKCEKIKNVFRLGSKAQTTIVYLKTFYYMHVGNHLGPSLEISFGAFTTCWNLFTNLESSSAL